MLELPSPRQEMVKQLQGLVKENLAYLFQQKIVERDGVKEIIRDGAKVKKIIACIRT